MKKIIILAVVLVLAGCNSIIVPSWAINSAVLNCQHHNGVSQMYESGSQASTWVVTCNDGIVFKMQRTYSKEDRQCSSE